MKEKLVSIIIPIYNVSEYLDACVQSACDQSYSNLEIILVNDGSTDDCPLKCEKWAKRDGRIRVIHKNNGGLSDARNAGLDVVKGEYIYFLDGDDTIKPELVETVVSYMDEGEDMVSFRYDKIYPEGNRQTMTSQIGGFDLSDSEQRISFLFQILLPYHIGWEAWSNIYSRKIIERYHIRFVDNKKIFAEDLYFSLVYCAHAKHIRSIPESLYNYMQRSNSIMGRNKNKLNIGRLNELGKAALEHFQKFEECNVLVKRFPAIHYMILDSSIMSLVHKENFRQMIFDDIADLTFFRKQLFSLHKFREDLCLFFSGSQAEERINIVRYLANGNYVELRIRNHLTYRFSDVIDRNAPSMKKINKHYKKIAKQDKRIFFIGAEDFGNVGDYQINESLVAFLHKTLPEYKIYEVSATNWKLNKPFLKKYIRKRDLIILTGGGNFGNIYPVASKIKEEVIQLWKNNCKIVFPQTIFYTNDAEGKEAISADQKLYTRAHNIVLFTRDYSSYIFAQGHFSCESYLVPDIVLSSDYFQGKERKPQILMCFRKDKEKVLTDEERCKLERMCADSDVSVEYTDLQLDCHYDRKNQRQIIDQKINLWRESSLVVTDRLHGMIFAAITGTPCVAFGNFNHKVRETYEWIQYLPYIKYAENVDEAKTYIPELLKMENCFYNNGPLRGYFEKFAELIKKNVEK